MAESPAHRLGQILGEVLEIAVDKLLVPTARKHQLYLDRKELRPARKGMKCSWQDSYGNTHDLDYVLERGGTKYKIGTPVAFIESAWRSYTKHSRAKAQEIQGAVLPVTDRHRMDAPFTGVVVAGMFTNGALTQLRSLGFEVLFFSVAEVVAAFQTEGVDVSFTEDTPLVQLADKVRRLERLSATQRGSVATKLVKGSPAKVAGFMGALEGAITRQVQSVRVLPLHGEPIDRDTIADAIQFVASYKAASTALPLRRLEILVKFNNGNRIDGEFDDPKSAIKFLEMFQTPLRPVVAPKEQSSR